MTRQVLGKSNNKADEGARLAYFTLPPPNGVAGVHPDRLVDVDETGVWLAVCRRRYGHVPRGEKGETHAPYQVGKKYTATLAIDTGGVVAYMISDAPATTATTTANVDCGAVPGVLQTHRALRTTRRVEVQQCNITNNVPTRIKQCIACAGSRVIFEEVVPDSDLVTDVRDRFRDRLGNAFDNAQTETHGSREDANDKARRRVVPTRSLSPARKGASALLGARDTRVFWVPRERTLGTRTRVRLRRDAGAIRGCAAPARARRTLTLPVSLDFSLELLPGNRVERSHGGWNLEAVRGEQGVDLSGRGARGRRVSFERDTNRRRKVPHQKPNPTTREKMVGDVPRCPSCSCRKF